MILAVTVKQPRSVRQLRFYKSLCRKVSDALVDMGDETSTPERVDDRFRMVTGHYEAYPLSLALQKVTGQKVGIITRSIDFDAMDQQAFNKFMNLVTAFTLTELLPHIPTGKLRKEIEAMFEEGE